jgi:hypothetical protein
MYAAYGVRGNPMTIQKYLELFKVLCIFKIFYKHRYFCELFSKKLP